MTHNAAISPFAHQRGITLIESLVAIVVMALGILGILGVQMRTLTDTQGGVRRAQAIRLIEDLGERLQNNPDALGNLSKYTEKPTSSDDCASGACAPDRLATYDIKQWHSSVGETLPNGKAITFIPKGGPRQLGVLIAWNENRYNQNGQSFSDADTTAIRNRILGASDATTTSPTLATDADDNPVRCVDPDDPNNADKTKGLICHLQYIQPTQRCTPWGVGGGTLYCPN
ncbi:type IV pilus modification protein PilV [Diaphorobacter nitroreducens]|uniref:type IV pilus modification protein PilV n=1 Tax=Diaphorobacter TaxID=238749 RepID=UPI00206E85CD|nr:type IV pilus modification protein PilV [Diaphorobacter nitroreducens]UOB04443.1 type IV pilus modification protein PilV [Diaphorobacter sp. LI3]